MPGACHNKRVGERERVRRTLRCLTISTFNLQCLAKIKWSEWATTLRWCWALETHKL